MGARREQERSRNGAMSENGSRKVQQGQEENRRGRAKKIAGRGPQGK
jgi:hypothetical protein